MCGIGGILSFDDAHRVTRDVLARMAARIAHRGPDGEAFYLNHQEQITPARPQLGMAFRRLAVLDCDERAMQPMTTLDGRFTLVFNGEIYNFRDLRKELSTRDPGHVWTTTGDSEVLLHALATWGEAAVPKLRGMFAIALWDEREKSLLLARDRMGQKPLYFTLGRWSVAFASEPAALRPWADWDQMIDHAALAEYLRFGYVAAPGTIETGIAQVMPGHTLRINNTDRDAWVQTPYFDPNAIGPATTGQRHGSGVDALIESATSPRHGQTWRTRIERAVESQLVSDVPLGVFLSGGIDSSVIAACARKHGPVKTFSIGFDDPRYDESIYAAEVAKHLGTDHHAFHVTPAAADDLPKLAAAFGEPFGDSSSLPTHYLSRETRRHVTVALSGDGGDELFGGYDRYRAIGLRVGWLRPLAPLGLRLARGHPKSTLTRVGRLLASASAPSAARYLDYVSIFTTPGLTAVLPDVKTPHARWFAREWDALSFDHDATQTALAIDRVAYLPGDLLYKTDRCSMLHALEVRSPFLDHDLVTAAAGLTRKQLLGGGKKRALREAFAADLPASVFARPKMGFAVPVGDWLRGPLRAMLRDHLFAAGGFARGHLVMPAVERLVAQHESRQANHAQRLYALLMLELWWRTRSE
ncbi:MAG TPA: asparagine synthase (glutamine-hydrolyzing) [Tepidisphaeraceae bacterium]